MKHNLIFRMAVSDTKVKGLESSSDANITEGEENFNSEPAPKPYVMTTHADGVYKGLLLAFICGVIFAHSGVIVKYLKTIHPVQIAIYRFIGIFTLSLPLSVKNQSNLLGPREFRFLLLLRGIFGTTTVFLCYLAYRYLPLGEATVIMYTAPVFISIAAKVFLKESCGIFQSVIVFITVIGVIFILKVPALFSGSSVSYTTEYIYGLTAAFSSVISSTGVFVVLRKLTGVHHSIIMLNFGWIGIILSSVLIIIIGHFNHPACGLQQWLVVLLGIISQTAVTLFTMSLQLENAGPVATMRAAIEVIICFLWQVFFFRDYPDGFSIAGAVFLGLSIVLAGIGKWATSLAPDSTAAKYLKCFST